MDPYLTIVASVGMLTCGAIAGFALWTTYKLRLVMALAVEHRAQEQNVALGVDGTVPEQALAQPSPEQLRREAIDEAYRAVIARGHTVSAEEERLLGIS